MYPFSNMFTTIGVSALGASLPVLLFWTITLLPVALFYFKSLKYRGLVGLWSLIGVLSGFICACIAVSASRAAHGSTGTAVYSYFFFYGVSTSFIYTSFPAALWGFKDNNKLSRCCILLGFIWILAGVAAGIVVTVLTTNITKNGYGHDELLSYNRAVVFLFMVSWGFVAINIMLFIIYLPKIGKNNGRTSFIFYILITTLSLAVNTVIAFVPSRSSPAFLGISIIFSDITVLLALLLLFFKAHVWRGDREESEQQEIESNDSNSQQQMTEANV